MQKSSIVICINDTFLSNEIGMYNKLPVKGQLYMVRDIIPGYCYPADKPGITVEEIYGKIITYKCFDGVIRDVEFHFIMDRFIEVLPPVSLELLLPEEVEFSI